MQEPSFCSYPNHSSTTLLILLNATVGGAGGEQKPWDKTARQHLLFTKVNYSFIYILPNIFFRKITATVDSWVGNL